MSTNYNNMMSNIQGLVGKDIDENLVTVLEQEQEQIDKLKSNVKWLYKYGGVGTGGGSSSGSSSETNWKVSASLGGLTLSNGQTVMLSSTGTYLLVLSVTRHGGKYYEYVIRQAGKKIFSGTFTSDDGKSYTAEHNISCQSNSNLTITVTDEDGLDYPIAVNYITNMFTPTINLVDNNNRIITNTELLADTYTSQGLYLRFTYTAPVETSIQYEMIDFEGVSHKQENTNGDTLAVATNETEIFKLPVSSMTTDISGDTYTLTFKYKLYYLNSNIFDNTSDPITYTMSIIPSTLFLKVVSSTLTLSKTELSESTNTKGMKSIQITPFEGERKNYSYNCTYTVTNPNGVTTSDNTNIAERTPYTVSINCSYTGTYKVTFSIYNVSNVASVYNTTVYFYITESIVNYEYYPLAFTQTSGTVMNYFRAGGEVTSAFNNISGTYIEQTASSNDKIYNLEYDMNGSQDLLFQIGLQYNIVNEDLPIFKLYDGNITSEAGAITVYPDKLYFGALSDKVTAEIYIPKLEVPSATDHTKYHLISIYKRLVQIDTTTNDYYYELVVYIDGILEGSLENFVSLSTKYDTLVLYGGNYYVDYIEATTFTSVNKQTMTPTVYTLTDADIVKNYYTYQCYIQNSEDAYDKLSLLNSLDDSHFTFDLDTTLVQVDSKDTVTDIAKAVETPTLYLTVNQYTKYTPNNGLDFISWMLKSYGAEEDFMKNNAENGGSDDSNSGTIDTAVISDLQYMGNGDTEFKSYSLPDTEFTLDIQGTSTRENKTPNFTLALSSTSDDATEVPVFTPNFDINDPKSFLPETLFYLKADIADSAHSNNTATGKFVNDNTTKFLTNLEGELANHIKQCLDGFPVLVYIQFGANTSTYTAPIYFIGIYNFNLGRGSNYNLGYKPYDVFYNEAGALKLSSGFQLLELTKDEFNQTKQSLTIAEVLEKTAYFDFSQYDSNVLFPITDDDTTCMYGDFVSSRNALNEDNYKVLIQNFTEKISHIGGFIFETIGKTFGLLTEAYHGVDSNGNFKNQVPDYTTLYTRDTNDVTKFYAKPDKIKPITTQADLIHLIQGESGVYGPILDYDSLVEYYTICMAFGLVDSVQKNLNIKSWTEQTINGTKQGYFHIAFYDMDTGYGIDNQGDNTSYVSFSDYWYSPDAAGSVVNINDTVNNVYRDYYPLNPRETGYDVPSTYLFAIAKYARSLVPDSVTKSPQTLWSSWRQSSGPLSSADNFIANYYNSSLDTVPEQLFNLNYRAKYFVLETETANAHKFHTKDWKQFKGRKLYKVRDWLNDRFHILDAYFGLDAAENQTIYKLTYDENGDVELTDDGGLNWVTTNYTIQSPTVQPTSDMKYRVNIFTGSADTNSAAFAAKNVDTELELQALDYSPFMYKIGSTNGHTFMLNDSQKTYKIPFSVASNNTLCYFYGSYYLTNIGSITAFISSSSSFSLYSQYIQSIKGDSGTINSFNINYAPSLKSITLTSSGYSGTLALDNSLSTNYPQLTSVDISNSAIALTCNSIPVQTLNISNIKSSSVTITNCKYITDLIVQSNNSDVIECTTLSITPLNCKTVVFDGQSINTLSLQSGITGSSITVKNDKKITSLSLINFETIVIDNCPNLTNLSLSGDNIKSVTLTNSNISELDLYACKNVNYVNVNTNKSLATLILNQNSETQLKYLNISDTVIKTLNWSDDDHNITTGTDGYITLTNATSLINSTTAFICNNNTGVEYISFPNNGTPGTYLKDNWDQAVRVGSFYGCSKLQRIYGNIIITDGDHTFGGCYSFSIHGGNVKSAKYKLYSETEQYVYTRVYQNETVLMPYQLQYQVRTGNTDVDSIEPKSYYFDGGTESMDVMFQEGDDATNMSFDIKSFEYTFDSTGVTLFDIYYVFSNANPVSSYDKSTGTFKTTALSFNTTFGSAGWIGNYTAGGTVDKFKNYTISRYMLHNVTSFSSVFSPFEKLSFSYYVPFISPTMNGSTCVKNDGWYSPLWNVVSVYPNQSTNTTSSLKMLLDYNFFRHTDDDEEYAAITVINGMQLLMSNDSIDSSTKAVGIDEITDDNYLTYFGSYGSMGSGSESLFSRLQNMESIEQLSIKLLDFSTIKLPDSLKYLTYAFVSVYGTGELNFNSVFTSNSKLKNLYNGSFSQTTGDAYIMYDNNTFKPFSNLVNIGVNTNDGASNVTYRKILNIKKYVDPADFPYDMFNPEIGCPNSEKIETLNAVFYKLEPSNTALNKDAIVQLPGRLCEHMKSLTCLYQCFSTLNINHSLTGEGFKNCNSLQVVTEAFATDNFRSNKMYDEEKELDDSLNVTYLQGGIPYRFLYHGTKLDGTEYTNIKRMDYLFANQDIDYYVNENPTSVWDYDGVHGRATKYDGKTNLMTSGILTVDVAKDSEGNMLQVTFIGNMIDNNLIVDETYSVSNTTGYTMSIENNIITSPDIPVGSYKVLWNDTINVKFTKDDKVVTATINVDSPYLYSIYDDIHYEESYETNKPLLEEYKFIRTYSINTISGTTVGTNYPINNYGYFCCPPDLFKYCVDLSSLNVKGVFKNCGSGYGSYKSVSNGTILYGLKGRIPPYLFMPITKVTNVTEMFYNCKALSYYCTNIDRIYNDEGAAAGYNSITSYLVPRTLFKYTPNLTNMTSMFFGNIFSYSNTFNCVLPNIKGLITTLMFMNSRWTNTQGNGDNVKNDYYARFVIDYPLFQAVPMNFNYMFAQDSTNELISVGAEVNCYPEQYMQFGDEDGSVNIYGLNSYASQDRIRVFAGYSVDKTIAPALGNGTVTKYINIDPLGTLTSIQSFSANWHYIKTVYNATNTEYTYTLYPKA